MPVTLEDDVAESALRAACKTGAIDLVENLINSGVSATKSAAILYADFYEHPEVSKIIRKAMEKEETDPVLRSKLLTPPPPIPGI